MQISIPITVGIHNMESNKLNGMLWITHESLAWCYSSSLFQFLMARFIFDHFTGGWASLRGFHVIFLSIIRFCPWFKVSRSKYPIEQSANAVDTGWQVEDGAPLLRCLKQFHHLNYFLHILGKYLYFSLYALNRHLGLECSIIITRFLDFLIELAESRVARFPEICNMELAIYLDILDGWNSGLGLKG